MMYKSLLFTIGLFLFQTVLFAQRDDIVLVQEKKEFAYRSIKDLREGAMVVRLQTNQRKIEILERTLRSPKLTDRQRKRHKEILEGTIKRRDQFNQAIADMFMDSFKFCKVYLMYDTSSKALTKGLRQGIFLDKNKNVDASIELTEEHVFIVNYKKKSGEFPFDVLRVRRLEEKLDEPFPYYATLRESWINQVNTPRAGQAVAQLERRFRRFYNRAIEYDEKMEERNARRAANKEQPAEDTTSQK